MFHCEPLRWLLIGRIIFRTCEKHRTSVHDSDWTYHYFGSCAWIEPFLKIASMVPNIWGAGPIILHLKWGLLYITGYLNSVVASWLKLRIFSGFLLT